MNNNQAVDAMNIARDGFDPRQSGILEDTWLTLLADQDRWVPAGVPLIVVAPHPDDETLGAGGLIASFARRSRPVIVVSVTDGEASHRGWEGLRDIRRAELKRALHCLSPHMILRTRVGLADGEVAQHEESLRLYLLRLVTPGAVMIAPYERDGHPDHDAVGRICREVAAASGVCLARYPIWAWHHGDWQALKRARWGLFELTDEARLAKAQALDAFNSQLRPRFREPILPPHVLRYFQRPYEAFLL